jgi:hypothetical protein
MPASTRPRHKKPPVPREDVLDLVAPARLRCPAPVPPARCRPDPPIRRRRRHHSPACPDSGAIARRCSAPVPLRSRTQPASAHSRSRSADAYAPRPPTCLYDACVNSSALVTSVPTASVSCYATFKTPFAGRLPGKSPYQFRAATHLITLALLTPGSQLPTPRVDPDVPASEQRHRGFQPHRPGRVPVPLVKLPKLRLHGER